VDQPQECEAEKRIVFHSTKRSITLRTIEMQAN
jgi:hypothetical protein